MGKKVIGFRGLVFSRSWCNVKSRTGELFYSMPLWHRPTSTINVIILILFNLSICTRKCGTAECGEKWEENNENNNNNNGCCCCSFSKWINATIRKTLNFITRAFGVLAFRFQSHLRAQSNIPNTIPYAITHTLLHSHRRECSTLCTVRCVVLVLHNHMCVCVRCVVYSLLFEHARPFHRVSIRAHEAYQ